MHRLLLCLEWYRLQPIWCPGREQTRHEQDRIHPWHSRCSWHDTIAVTLTSKFSARCLPASLPLPPTPQIRLMAAEHEIREITRLRKLNELHTARTIGTRDEAAILLECGRVLATEAFQYRGRAVLPCGIAANRWASHICRELRRNRFAAQRGAMRRNVVPTAALSVAPLSPRQPTRQGKVNANISVRISPASRGESSRRARSSHTRYTKERGGLISEGGTGGSIAGYDARSHFDAALSARGASRVEASSPLPEREAIEDGSVVPRPASVGGPISMWGGGKQDVTSPR